MCVKEKKMFLKYVKSDVYRLYPNGRHIWLKCILNPGFHAVLLIRLAQFSPVWLFWLWRNILILKHSIDLGGGFYIAQGLRLPHPISIVIGGGVKIGSNVTIYQSVTLGKNRNGYPTIHDNVTIYPSSVIVGSVEIGDSAVIGALSYISKDVEPNKVIRRGD